jgi:acyl-CoA synthetase (AMP-forming)/AMP-acid ligase II
VALNIADLFEHAVDVVPERTAIIVGERQVTYAELEAQANQLAHHLAAQGIGLGDHVGIYAKNSIEHVVALIAIYKIRAVAININYRYVEGELDYIFDNADLVAVLHEAEYTPLVEKVAPKHSTLRTVIVLEQLPEIVGGQSSERDFAERSADDLYIVYTGGTTGYPKGVMWRHVDFWRVLGGGIDFMTGDRLEEYDQAEKAKAGDPMIMFPLSPLMHGGAQWAMLMHLFGGHATILTPKFEPDEVWESVDEHKVQMLFMTGDAMARPLIEEFETGKYDGSSLFVVSSSAAIFSRPIKERWMDAFPNAIFTDSIGASETGFQGLGMVSRDSIGTEGPVCQLGPDVAVIDEKNQIIDPSRIGEVGRLARTGSVPVGYYKDPVKSAETFLEVDGKRHSVPGDCARIEEGNIVTRLGRGSNCINTGGEKVYPEEVEMALKSHPDVFDTLVIGTPDERFGQAVTAVVQPREGAEPTLESLKEHLRASLSGYKLPRSLVLVSEIPRHATGKANYPEAKRLATSALDPA